MRQEGKNVEFDVFDGALDGVTSGSLSGAWSGFFIGEQDIYFHSNIKKIFQVFTLFIQSNIAMIKKKALETKVL